MEAEKEAANAGDDKDGWGIAAWADADSKGVDEHLSSDEEHKKSPRS